MAVHSFSFPVDYGLYEMATLPQAYRDTFSEAARRELESWASSLDVGDWTVRTRIAEGTAPDVIRRLAEEESVDLVAMGTHGHGRVSGVFLGNVARRTLQQVTCPVLTVRRVR